MPSNVDTPVACPKIQSTHLEVLVLELGHNQMLLGIDWLNFHNPEVNWSMLSLQFTCCPKCCSKSMLQLTIRWTAKAEKQPMVPPKPEIDENGLSKGPKPNYIKPFQHLFEKKNFNKLPICCERDHEINLCNRGCASINPGQTLLDDASRTRGH